MYKSISILLFVSWVSFEIHGQTRDQTRDDSLSIIWPPEFGVVEIRSTADGSLQKARFHASTVEKGAPLIVSLHTWSGDYNQEDPLAGEILKRGWNYIHPDFRGPNNRPEAGGSDLVIADIGDAINYALRNSDADPDDVHLIGVSGGGYATLAAFMKLNYPVRSFNSWAAISDLEAWYDECRSRKLQYSEDIEKITTGGAGFDALEARHRSPLQMDYPAGKRRGAYLNIYTGINDGYSGSVPITHSINFFNRIADIRYPDDKGLVVADSLIIKLLGRRIDPQGNYEKRVAGRNVYLSSVAPDMSLTIFEGGHEMLVPHALSLIPVRGNSTGSHDGLSILVIGDSNGYGPDAWPEQLKVLMPRSTVCNTSRHGNTIGFDNLDNPELNTLKNIDRYIDMMRETAGKDNVPDMVIVALGTNDTKHFFRNRQKEISSNISSLLDKIKAGLPGSKIYIVTPPPVFEEMDSSGKFRGSAGRVEKLAAELRKRAITAGNEIIDLNRLLKEKNAAVTVDGVHLNRDTQYEVASFISEVITGDSKKTSSGAQDEITAPDANVILPPAWAFGLMYGGYTDQEGTIERIKAIQEHDYPIDAYWIDSWFWSYADSGAGPKGYLDFVGDTVAYPDRKAMWSWMEQNNIRGGFWIWDCIQETGNEEVFRDFLDRGFFSGVYLNRNPWHNKGTTTAMFSENRNHPGTLCGNIDFDNPKAVNYFKEKVKPFFEEGADFIKLDRTDKISVCKTMHELTSSEGTQTGGRGLILSHSGGTGSEEYKRYPLKWTDDTRSDWTVESPLVKFDPWVPMVALKENIAMYTDPSLSASRIPFLTNDLGGFDMGKVVQPEEELYIRWMQFSMFCPVTEVFCQPENPTSNLAWKYSPLADSLFRTYSHMRLRLFPYLYSYAHLSRLTGVNMVRPIPGELYMYMLGNELLVAPVHEKGMKETLLHLPRGKWINYWTGDIYEGQMEHLVAAPLELIPLFVRQGSVIPERGYTSSVEKGTNDTLTLHVYPGADGSFTLIEDDGCSNDYLKGSYATTMITLKEEANGFVMTIEASEGSYMGMKSRRNWLLKMHSAKQYNTIKLNGKKLPHQFNRERSVTEADLGRHSKDKKIIIRVTS